MMNQRQQQRPASLSLPLPRIIRGTAFLSCAAVLAMVGIFIATGVGQEGLQIVRTDYADVLLKNPSALRACLALDDLFIALYTGLFVALAVLLVGRGASRALTIVATGFLVVLGLLDMMENFHFLAMLANAELGALPSTSEIEAQVWESMLKFHVGGVGVLLLSFALPRDRPGARTIAGLTWFVSMPVGALVDVVPHAVAVPLVFARFLYFLAALFLVGLTFGRDDAAPSGSGARA